MTGGSLESMRNLGPKSAAMLRSAGVGSPNALQAIGEVAAFLAVEQSEGRTPSRNLLWALHGAIHDCDWSTLSEQIKDDLVGDVDRMRNEKTPRD